MVSGVDGWILHPVLQSPAVLAKEQKPNQELANIMAEATNVIPELESAIAFVQP